MLAAITGDRIGSVFELDSNKPDYDFPLFTVESVFTDDIWFQLDIPDYLIKITRCDETGKPSITGNKWKVEQT